MMKLRTKSQNLTLADEQTPSTSSASATFVHSGTRRLSSNSNDQHSSPDSPVIGRIAKSNARILNGLDLNDVKRSGICYGMCGIFPELKVDDLNADKYPSLWKQIVNSGNKKKPPLEVDNLQFVQHELEDLIGSNVDCQKTITGEISYLSTGDYPTSDLSSRLMPKYELCLRHGFHHGHIMEEGEHTMDRESFTKFLIELGLLSSPEEEEPPSIVDVPNRFWTWAKEYLEPVSRATLREFKQKMLDRFVGERYTSRFIPPPLTPPKMALSAAKTAPPAPVLSTPPKKGLKRRVTDAQQCQRHHLSSAAETSPTKKMLKLDKSLSSEESMLVVPLAAAAAKGCGSACDAIRHQLLLSNGGGIVSAKNGIVLDKIVSSTTVTNTPAATITPAAATPVEKDEVTVELQKKQQQLKLLYEQTRPVVEQLYGRLRAEYAVHQVFKRMDSADNTLLQQGSKYRRLPFFDAEQRREAQQAVSAHAKVYRMFHGQRENE